MLFSGAFAVAVQIRSHSLNLWSLVNTVNTCQSSCILWLFKCARTGVCASVRVRVLVSVICERREAEERARRSVAGREGRRRRKMCLLTPTPPAFGALAVTLFPFLMCFLSPATSYFGISFFLFLSCLLFLQFGIYMTGSKSTDDVKRGERERKKEGNAEKIYINRRKKEREIIKINEERKGRKEGRGEQGRKIE